MSEAQEWNVCQNLSEIVPHRQKYKPAGFHIIRLAVITTSFERLVVFCCELCLSLTVFGFLCGKSRVTPAR